MRAGAPTPAPMLTRPKLLKQARWYNEVYGELSRSRTLGSGGEYYIPLSEFDALFNIRRIRSVEKRMRVIRVIRKVDEHVLQMRAEKRQMELKKAG